MQPALFLIFAGVVLVVSAHSHQSQYSKTILVVESRDANQSSTCSSFECIGKSLSNSTKVTFTLTEIILNTTVRIENYTNIAFIGSNATTTLICDSSTGSNDTGLIFNGVTDLIIARITVSGCGSQWQKGSYFYSSAIYVLNSVNFQFQLVTIRNSNGRGLIVFNTHGNVSVEDTDFIQNRLQTSGKTGNTSAGGVHLEFSSETTGSCSIANHCQTISVYTFNNCSFDKNDASVNHPDVESKHVASGGGIFISLNSTALRYHVHISDTNFVGNAGAWGGGCHVVFHTSSNHNKVTITDTYFHGNQATIRAGGGIDIGYSFQEDSVTVPRNNSVLVQNCNFTNNRAIYGGAVNIYASKSRKWCKHQDVFEFRNCRWYNNAVVTYGSAVDISPSMHNTLTTGWIPVLPVFENCIFQNNHFYYNVTKLTGSHLGQGTLYATSFTVQFRGTIVFQNNTLSAVYLVSSTLSFSAGTDAIFVNNTGINGGAIALVGFSALHVNDNSTFNFTGNRAEKGGAIYYWSIDRHDYISTKSCFIQYQGLQNVTSRNISLAFHSNKAVTYGNAIYASSIFPCHFGCHGWINYPINLSEPFQCVGNFTYNDGCTLKSEISTSGQSLSSEIIELEIIPGKDSLLPVKLLDEFGTIVNETYHLKIVSSENSSISFDKAHSYAHDNRMEVYGWPNDSGVMEVSTLLTRVVSLTVKIRMLDCPPGFIVSSENTTTGSTMLHKCICSVNSNSNFIGIDKCNMTEFRAYIGREYWAGYENNIVRYDNLLIGYCPSGLCGQTYSRANFTSFLLPHNASNEALDSCICGDRRTGVLCTKCQSSYSVSYHATSLYCGSNKLCRWGWLFYILSELLPLTVIFALIMIFNISFTSGVANSFILFAQLFDIRILTADGSIWVTNTNLWVFLRVIHFIYRFFNFEFFTEEHLSFCLWEGANTLDIIAFKYVTMAYGLLLLGLTVMLVKSFKCSNRLSPGRMQNSIIHGMTAFLVLCYSYCAQVTFQILTPSMLLAINEKPKRTVATFNGEVVFMSVAHLKYAIPAMLCLSTVVLLPPLLLVLYPAYSKLFSLLKLNDTKFAQIVSLRVEKFKPLFDSFQGCYKDEYRFFAGYYFVVRLLSEVTDAFTQTNTHYYVIMDILLIVTIMLYVLCRPYKKNWHNVLDGLVFADLLIINVLAIVCDYQYIPKVSDAVVLVQALLALLPLLYIIVYYFTSLIGILKKKRNKSRTEAAEEFELPARLIPDAVYDEYHRYEEVL